MRARWKDNQSIPKMTSKSYISRGMRFMNIEHYGQKIGKNYKLYRITWYPQRAMTLLKHNQGVLGMYANNEQKGMKQMNMWNPSQ